MARADDRNTIFEVAAARQVLCDCRELTLEKIERHLLVIPSREAGDASTFCQRAASDKSSPAAEKHAVDVHFESHMSPRSKRFAKASWRHSEWGAMGMTGSGSVPANAPADRVAPCGENFAIGNAGCSPCRLEIVVGKHRLRWVLADHRATSVIS